MKLNLGCGQFPLAGYVNVDMVCDEADVKGDFMDLVYEEVEEVAMFHLLEHLPITQAQPALALVRGWLRDGGTVVVEVPNWDLIAAYRGPFWQEFTFGVQSHEGEFHYNGFTVESLVDELNRAGFAVTELRTFASEHPARRGYPCLLAKGVKR